MSCVRIIMHECPHVFVWYFSLSLNRDYYVYYYILFCKIMCPWEFSNISIKNVVIVVCSSIQAGCKTIYLWTLSLFITELVLNSLCSRRYVRFETTFWNSSTLSMFNLFFWMKWCRIKIMVWICTNSMQTSNSFGTEMMYEISIISDGVNVLKAP